MNFKTITNVRFWLAILTILLSVTTTISQNQIIIKSPGLYPEGLVYDAVSESFFTTSVSEGKIIKVDKSGNFSVFAEDNDLISAIGLEIDSKQNRLVLCNSDLGVGKKSSAATMGTLASVVFYNLKTGKREKYINLTKIAPAGAHLANDVTMDSDGNYYVTDSFAPIIYKIDSSGKPSIFINDERLVAPQGTFGLNGLVYHPDGYLITAIYNGGKLFKIPLKNPTGLTEIHIANKPFPTIDGVLLIDHQTLALASNNLTGADFPSVVYKIATKDQWTTAQTTAHFKTGNTFPTTLTKAGDALFVMYAKLQMLFGGNDTVAQTFEITRVDFNSTETLKTQNNMSQKTLMIVNAVLIPEQKEAFAEYSEKSALIFKNAGAVPVGKYKVSKTLVGTRSPQLIAIMEFPDQGTIEDVFNSESYKNLIPLRDQAFKELEVFIVQQQ
ncbi:DUF1330 domain-containing protein [Arenibacter sp. GZD96]|uniref:DUF1330 domain-containing protein n=1 Tax=Aurantibrevibacter litoralis TaxID=3106030 RepID=UPI002B0018B7|nr:DUF1330 domain-containing protein [Arenibacter sp. GZD-96]MEA1785465.1 DUF1330 domain-containing protein [Arenibacter sp. GZD-96]